MDRGHDPRAIDDYAWRDIEAYLDIYPFIRDLENPFADAFNP